MSTASEAANSLPVDEAIAASRSLTVNYHRLLTRSPDAVLLLDLENDRIVDANESAQQLFGLPESRILLHSLAALCPPQQPDGSASEEALARQTQAVLSGDKRLFRATFRHADGRDMQAEIRYVQLPLADQRLMHARIVDVTRQSLDEQLRIAQGQVLEMVARGAPLKRTLDCLLELIELQSPGVLCSILLLDSDGKTIRPMSAPSLPASYMEALDGFPIGPEVGSCGTAMFLKETVIVSDIENDPLWAPYKELTRPHGLRACWSTPIYLEREQVLGTFAMYYREVRSPKSEDMRLIAIATHLAGIAIERTRREQELVQYRFHLEELVKARTAELSATLDHLSRTQEELLRRDKLAALGTLVAGIAHELNTPIGNSLVAASTMSDHAAELSASLANGLRRSTLDAYLDETRTAGDLLVRNLTRAADLLASFKQISVDHTTSQRRSFDLGHMLAELLPALRANARHTCVHIEMEAEPGLQMDSYPGSLSQVISNLFDNCLAHAFKPDQAGTVRLRATRADADNIRLDIEDDGAGIAPDVLPRVFDPFFTTHLGSGSGLGLHVAHNIVTGILGGRISATSTPGHGANFTLLLPPQAPHPES